MAASSVTAFVTALLLFVWLDLPQLGECATYLYDNNEYVYVYDDSSRKGTQAKSHCSSNYQTQLATIESMDLNKKLMSLDPFAGENSTENDKTRECWIGLEYRLIDVYDPYPYLVPTIVNISVGIATDTSATSNENVTTTLVPGNRTEPAYLSYNEYVSEYTPTLGANSTYNGTLSTVTNLTLCYEIVVENFTDYDPQTIIPCVEYTNYTVSNRTSGNRTNETVYSGPYCYYEAVNITTLTDYDEEFLVCRDEIAYNYSNYYGFIWGDNSSLVFENWYNLSYWTRDIKDFTPTTEPTEPPVDANGTAHWAFPSTAPTISPTVWEYNETFCVTMDMDTGEWYPHRDCDGGGDRFHCYICDTNLFIAENNDFVFHYDLTENEKLAKNWDEADQFCRDNYQRKACSIRNKDDDIAIMDLIFVKLKLKEKEKEKRFLKNVFLFCCFFYFFYFYLYLYFYYYWCILSQFVFKQAISDTTNYTEKVENWTLTERLAIIEKNDSDELAMIDELLDEYYFDITWLQSENQYFRETKHEEQSVWFGLYGEVVYEDYCYHMEDNDLDIPDWLANYTEPETTSILTREFIFNNVLNLTNCNWTLTFYWIDREDFNSRDWYDFSWGTGATKRKFPKIDRYNWQDRVTVWAEKYDDYGGTFSPASISCAAIYYNQTAADWRWNLYPCEYVEKIAWCCNAPIRKYHVTGESGLSENTWKNRTSITASGTLLTLIFILPITLFITVFCIKYYLIDKSGDFVIDCVDFLICTKCRSNYQRQKAAEAGNLLTTNKVKNVGLAGWLGVNFSQKLSAVAAYAEDTETQEYLYEIHWPKEAQYWGQPSRLNELEYFIRLSSKRTMLRVWKVFDEDQEDKIEIKETWSRVMYCWLAMYLIEKHEGQVEAPPAYDRVRPIFDKISYELTHFLPKKQKDFMTKEDYMDNFRRWLYKICRRRQILLKRYRPKLKKERERLEIEDPNRPKDSHSSDDEPPVLFNPGSIIFSDIKAKDRKTFDSSDESDGSASDESNSIKDREEMDDYEAAVNQVRKIDHQFSTKQIVPVRKDISMKELHELGKNNKTRTPGSPSAKSDHEVAPNTGLNVEDLDFLEMVDDKR